MAGQGEVRGNNLKTCAGGLEDGGGATGQGAHAASGSGEGRDAASRAFRRNTALLMLQNP